MAADRCRLRDLRDRRHDLSLRDRAGTYREDTVLDAGWPALYVLVAFAACQPAKRLDPRALRGWAMLVLPASSALVSFGSSSLITSHGVNVLAVALATASLLVGVARFVLTFRENMRMLHFSEEEATTDALTGLGNRRALLADLEAVGRDSEGSSHMLLLFDLDGLKSYNDAFGHPAVTRCWSAWGPTWPRRSMAPARPIGWAAMNSVVLARVVDDNAHALAARAAALSERGERVRVGCSEACGPRRTGRRPGRGAARRRAAHVTPTRAAAGRAAKKRRIRSAERRGRARRCTARARRRRRGARCAGWSGASLR